MIENQLNDYIQSRGIEARIIPLSIPTPTVESAAQAIGTTPEKIVKSLLFLIEGKPILVISSGTHHVDRKKLAKHFGVGRKRVKLADAEMVLSVTGYEVGAVPPFGHRAELPVILEEEILQQPIIYAGGGSISALLEVAPETILRVTGATILNLHDVSATELD